MACARPEMLLYVESYVLLTTLLIACLTVFGSWRRRSHSLKLKYSTWASYLLSTYLINYTMGLMKSATFRNELFSVWATFLIIFLGSADCISAYSLEDSENRKRYNLEIIVMYFWLAWLIAVHTHELKLIIPLYLLYFLSLRRTGGRAEALELASKSYGLVRNTKLVADFMEDESNKEGDEADPTCMKGYKYLVKGEKKAKVIVKAPHYHMQFETTDDHKIITIDMIWQCEGRLLSSTGDPDGRLKDICLSYALYRLLCRRFAKYSFPESSQLKTWNFVRYGLLSREGDDHERAFRVIELELGFLYDLFYTKYPVLFAKGLPLLRNFEFIIVIIGCWVAVSNLKNYQDLDSDVHLMTTGGHNLDALLTGVVLVAILFMEIVQFFVVNFSDWAKVQWLCYYVKKPLFRNKCMEMIIRIICHRKLLKPWDRKLSQYSLLESFSHNPSILLYNRWTSPYIDKPRNGLKRSAHVKLPMGVKKAIIHSLKTSGQRLTNGVASLQRNGVHVLLSWACELPTTTHVIMVWHIATILCELNLSSQVIVTGEQVNQQRKSEDFIVATKLSKYCAYLVAFAPRLLPDHPYITEFIFDHVVVEAREKLKGCEKSICQKMFNLCKDDRKKRIFEKMLTLGKEDGNQEIIEQGAVLAKDLLEKIDDNGRRCKILAELWTEMMLFVAPSDDETAHAEHLAIGGEFVTHLWALLSHAGILKRDSAQDV